MNEPEKLLLNLKLNRKANVVVSGNSMIPHLYDGDIVTVEPITGEDCITIGDVIVFCVEDHLVIHRIIDIIQTPTHFFVKTKGDNNMYDDGYMLSSRILGFLNEESKA